MASKQMRIETIEVAGPVVKNPKGQGGCVGWRNYVAPIVYVLADGRRIESTEGAQRKRDVLPGIEKDAERAKAGTLTASIDDRGDFVGTQTSFWIGPAERETSPRFDDSGYLLEHANDDGRATLTSTILLAGVSATLLAFIGSFVSHAAAMFGGVS